MQLSKSSLLYVIMSKTRIIEELSIVNSLYSFTKYSSHDFRETLLNILIWYKKMNYFYMSNISILKVFECRVLYKTVIYF